MARASQPARRGGVLAAGAVAVAVAIAGCGGGPSSSSTGSAKAPDPNGREVNPAGDIPDNQAYVPYSPAGGGFHVDVPEGWSRTGSGAATTFTDKLNSIRVESAPAPAPLTVKAAEHSELPKLASTVDGFQPGKVSTVTRKAGSAVLITYVASAPPDAVTGKTVQDAVERYSFFHRGRAVTLTLSGPKGADNVDPWRIVTDSLRWSR